MTNTKTRSAPHDCIRLQGKNYCIECAPPKRDPDSTIRASASVVASVCQALADSSGLPVRSVTCGDTTTTRDHMPAGKAAP